MHSHSRFDLESHHILVAFGNKSVHLFFRKSERVAHLHACSCVVLEILYFCALSLEFFWRVECYVCFPVLKQLVDIFLVYVSALALSVGSVVTTEGYTLVEFYSEPFE